MPIGIYTPPGGKPPQRRPLPDDALESAYKQMAGYSSSLLQTGLHVLDTPGAAVRGVLGSAVGARPAAGERTSGRDITDAVGLTSRSSKSFVSSIPGFAVELATDPLNYLSFGTKAAATGAGKALAKSGATRGWTRRQLLSGFDELESGLRAGGHTAEDVAHLRDRGMRIATPEHEAAVAAAGGKLAPGQPLAGLVSAGLPLVGPRAVFGAGGPLAMRAAGLLADVGGKLKYGTAVGRWANAMFDPNVREATGAATQKAMAKYGTPALESARIQARGDAADVTQRIHAALGAGFAEDDVLRAARQAGEGAVSRGVPAGLDPLAAEVGRAARAGEARQLDESMAVGLPIRDAADPYAQYLPRQGVDLKAARQQMASGPQWTSPKRTGPLAPGNIVPTVTSANYNRDDLYRAVPGGTERINDWVRQFGGNPKSLPLPDIARQLKKDMALEFQATRGPITKQVGKDLDAKAEALAGRLAGLSADHSAHGIGLYSNDLVRDVARSGEQHARTIASARAALGLIGDEARHASGLPSDAVPISQVLDQLKLITRPGDQAAATPIRGALVEAYRNLARQGAGPVDGFLNGSIAALRSEADQFALPRDVFDELTKAHAKWNTPETVRGPLGAFDQVTGAFKNLSYPLWPASHVRNAASALLNNLTGGAGLADHALQAKLMRGTATAAELARSVPDLPAGLADDAARQWVRNRQYATAKVYDGHAGQFDLDPIANRLQGNAPGQVTPPMAGSDRSGGGSLLADSAKLVAGKVGDQLRAVADKARHPLAAANPLEMAGVLGGRKDFPLLELGRTVGGNIEDLFRGAQWLGASRAGHTAEEAARLVRDTHFDYQNATDFERNVMRRVVPFYTYSRNNLPAQLSKLVHTPGQVATQMRAMGLGRDGDDYVPDYLAGGVAIPTGPAKGGKRQFVSSLGTPLEEALEPFRFKGGLPDVAGTTQAFASRINPLLKAPLEQLFDTQFHTGRRLSSLRPPATATAIGQMFGDDNPQLLSQILVNTPATRFVTAFDKLIDDRKGPLAKLANLGTGLRVTDVDLDKARHAEIAQARNELLGSMPHVRGHTNYYVRPEDAALLTPEEVELLQLQATMNAQSRRPQLRASR